MPQIARTPEQLALDSKIQKCKQLLRHLLNSQKSLRLKQKAERERARRASKLNTLDETIALTYGQLAHGLGNMLENGGNPAENGANVVGENAEDVDELEDDLLACEPSPKKSKV